MSSTTGEWQHISNNNELGLGVHSSFLGDVVEMLPTMDI